MVIPVEAVEAAAKTLAVPGFEWEFYRDDARKILEAAAPYIAAAKRGDGDYRPGWDDRKTLAGIWQEHAPLPAEGLSEAVYDALIAVATWGYEQRKSESL